jgi:hypothetical protein
MQRHTPDSPWLQEGGQTLVEFALTLLITLLLVFGLIEFSRAIYTRSVLQWAAQQGARTGLTEWETEYGSRIEGPSSAEVEALKEWVVEAVEGRLTSFGLDGAAAQVHVEPVPNTLEQPLNEIQVNVTYDFRFIVPLIGNPDEPLQLTAGASMVVH